MTPSVQLRDYADHGIAITQRVAAVRRQLTRLRETAADMMRIKLIEDLRDEHGNKFPPADQQELFNALFDPAAPPVPENYRAFVACLRIADREKGTPMEVSALIDAHFVARWTTSGLPVFSLTHGLAAALLLTEPPPFEPADFHLPFPAFAIVVPSGFVPFLSTTGQWGELVFVHQFVGKDNAGKTRSILHVDTRSETQNLWHRAPLEEVTSVKREQVIFGPGSASDPSAMTLIEDDYRTIEVALRLVRNLVAWVEAHGRGELQGRSTTRVRGSNYNVDRDGQPLPTTWVLGREVKLSPELRRLAPEVALGQRRGGPGWKLRMRYCVRGHWRNQAYGTGRAERKRIFIAPFWKGPEGAAAWAHVFTDEEQPTKES